MSFRHLSVILWTAVFLLGLELALEVRAASRGWPTLFLGGGVHEAAPEEWGPTEDFPFRSRFVDPEAPPGTRRLWLSSSSYGADEQLPAEVIFPTLLAELLSRDGTPTQVLNASDDGLAIVDNERVLRALGPRFRPDVVLLYQMSNDIDHVCAALATGALASIGAGEEAAPQGPDPVERLVESTTLWQHLKTQVSARLTKGRVLRHDLGHEGEELFEGYVRSFLAAAREVGARPVLCTFATSHTLANVSQMPREYEYNLLRFNFVLSIYGWLDSITRYNHVLERVAADEHVPLIDLAGAMAGRSELFRDLWHMTPAGHAFAAGVLAEGLEASWPEGGRGT